MCCGSNRAAARAAAMAVAPPAGSRQAASSGASMFELTLGDEAMVRGTLSGRLYHFAHHGARVRVDPRDEGGLLIDSRLRVIR